MKKLFLAVLTSTGLFSTAQNEGTVLYEMMIEGLPAEQASMMGDMTMKVVWKGDKVYSEQSSMMYEIKSVSDEKGTLLLMDQMGNKFYTKIDPHDSKYQEKEIPDYQIEYTNDTKKIAGYECKKAIIKSKSRDGKEFTADIWYTDQIPNFYEKQRYTSKRNQGTIFLKQIKGTPLEYTIPGGPYTIRVIAKEINFNPVPDDIFKLSTDGYTEMKPEQLNKMGGSGH